MTPKEKANELANKFISKSVFDMTDEELKAERELGKKYALICVEEVITMYDLEGYEEEDSKMEYWESVKDEINNLSLISQLIPHTDSSYFISFR